MLACPEVAPKTPHEVFLRLNQDRLFLYNFLDPFDFSSQVISKLQQIPFILRHDYRTTFRVST